MNIDELKKLIKESTAVLVLDNNEPSFVLMGYDMYRNMVANKGEEKEVKITQQPQNANSVNNYRERETDILDRLNKEILALKNQIETEERGMNMPSID